VVVEMQEVELKLSAAFGDGSNIRGELGQKGELDSALR
jgi:hypothetical protein